MKIKASRITIWTTKFLFPDSVKISEDKVYVGKRNLFGLWNRGLEIDKQDIEGVRIENGLLRAKITIFSTIGSIRIRRFKKSDAVKIKNAIKNNKTTYVRQEGN